MRKRSDVLEWINKAEQDYQTAVVMARKRKKPVPDVVGFHAQQCIEKYLKKISEEKGSTVTIITLQHLRECFPR